MNTQTFFIYLIVMAGVTYLIRAIPLTVFTGKIENRFIKSFLAYVPYAVLGAMTFPAIFTSTGSIISGSVGTAAALVLAFRKKGLLQVAVGACAAAFVAELVMMFV